MMQMLLVTAIDVLHNIVKHHVLAILGFLMGYSGSVELLFVYDLPVLVYTKLFLLLGREGNACIGALFLLLPSRLHTIYYPPLRR
jgi:hypothetical protein